MLITKLYQFQQQIDDQKECNQYRAQAAFCLALVGSALLLHIPLYAYSLLLGRSTDKTNTKLV